MWFPLIVLRFFLPLPCYPLLLPKSLSCYQCHLIQQGRQEDKLLLGISDPSCN